MNKLRSTLSLGMCLIYYFREWNQFLTFEMLRESPFYLNMVN